jgi:hypothetical protein
VARLTSQQIEADDGPSVLRCLALAVRSAHPASTSLYESASDACASSSNPSLAFDVVEQFQRLGQPTLAMHHGLIKAYITAEDVIAAQKHLRKMEQTSITPAQQSYRLVIQALLRDSTPQAWNLFAHMRLVAHPVPDAETYDLMIDACGNVRDPSPERAADLLAEMQEHRLQPTGNTYLGLIKACSRTFRDGKTPFYFQAIEYFRQMLAAGLTPTRDTLHALLMGSRIVGDLDRAYFIFNRMLAAGLQDDIAVNAQTVALLFDTYANYKLPERRALKVQAEQAEVEEVSAGENLLGSSEAEEIEALQNEEADVKVALPETASEVRGQLRTLMARLLAAHDKDYKAIFPEQDIDAVTLPSQLRSIHLAPSLLNSFLRAHMRFSTFEQQVPVMTALFNISDQQINGQTFKVMMKACAAAHDKAAGREEAQRIFTEWKEWAESKPLRTTAARSVWLTYVHVLARDNLAKEAYQELCAFYKLLPPSLIIDHAVQTVKAANLAPRPSVTLADDSYPETTSQHWQSRGFDQKDIVMLRKRMSDAENKTAIRKIKHMLKGYRDAEREAAAILKAGRVVNVPAKPTT